jgi:tRNA-specific 2-thiouridylase
LVMSKTVFVGMSGGVDSSVTALLLKQQDYNVIGVYMKNWADNLPGWHCPWREDLADAKRVAVQLGIDLRVYDFQEQYKQKVVDYLIDGYKQGITPNPDVMCNQEIKFRLFLDTALDDGADMIATGHYARTIQEPELQLKTALDDNKDQTYFLYRMPKDSLSKTIMPLGKLTKPEVRTIAAENNLVTATKKESMGICFVGKVPIKDFLKNYVTEEPGPIVDANGKEIGQHDGALFYTIGQRHGLSVGGGLPYYVTGKDMATNTVFVTTDLDDEKLWTNKLRLTSTNWLAEPENSRTYQIRTRHRDKLNTAQLNLDGDNVEVMIDKEIRAVTPGQSCVIYDEELVVGGGIIT